MAGRGVHTGRPARLRLLPAAADAGRLFRRVDIVGAPTIPADISNVSSGARATTISAAGARIRTTEHVLAALYGLSIDNVVIELDSDEVPELDGSALPFVDAIRRAGVADQGRPSASTALPAHVRNFSDGRFIACWPADQLSILYVLDYGEARRLAPQVADFAIHPGAFAQLSAARTFCFADELEIMRRDGLGLGVGEDTAVVYSTDLQPSSAPRLPMEAAVHKIVDLVGDLALLGTRVTGRVVAYRTGHAANHLFVTDIRGMGL